VHVKFEFVRKKKVKINMQFPHGLGRWAIQRVHSPRRPTLAVSEDTHTTQHPPFPGTQNRPLPVCPLPPVESRPLRCRSSRPSSHDEPNRDALGSGTAVRRREFAETPRPPAPATNHHHHRLDARAEVVVAAAVLVKLDGTV